VRWPPTWELVLRQPPASKDVKKEAEEAEKSAALEAFTRQQPMKIE
jgi:hypothetical protein